MLEGILGAKIVEFLSEYCEITQEHVKLSVFSGKGSLDHLVLKADAFARMFDLPVTVSRAIVRHVEFEIPWTSLKSSPCVVKVSEILACVTPPSIDMSEKDKQDLLARMKERILTAFEERRREAGRTAAQIAAAEAQEQEGSFASRLFEIILNNLVVEISNVHLRYECKHSEASSGIPHTVLGMTLSGVKLQTTDSDGKPTFVDTQTQTVVYKRWALDGLRMYSEETPKEPLVSQIEHSGGKNEILWDMRMREQLESDVTSHLVQESTIFGPLSCSADGALVLKKAIPQHRNRPYAQLSLRIGNLRASLNRAQYLSVMRAVIEMTGAVDRLPKLADQPMRQDLWPEYESIFMKKLLKEEEKSTTTSSTSAAAAASSASPAATTSSPEKRLEELTREINADAIIKCRRRVYAKVAQILAQRQKDAADTAEKALASHEAEKQQLRAQAAEKGFFSSLFVKFSTSKEAINKELSERQSALKAIEQELGINTTTANTAANGGGDNDDFVPDLADLPRSYEWLHMHIRVASLGITLKLDEGRSNNANNEDDDPRAFVAPCIAEMNDWNVVIIRYNGQGSALFDVTSRSLRVTNPTRSRKLLPELVTAAPATASSTSSSAASRTVNPSDSNNLLSVKALVRPLKQPIPETTLDLDLSVTLRALHVVLDPAMYRDLANFFKVPSKRSIIHDTLGAAKRAAIGAVAEASATVYDAVTHLKTVRLSLDATAPTWLLPQAVGSLTEDSPLACVSLGRFVLKSSPPTDADKARRLTDITEAVEKGTVSQLPNSTVFDTYHATLQDVCVAYTEWRHRKTFAALLSTNNNGSSNSAVTTSATTTARTNTDVFFFIPPIVVSCDVLVRLTTTLEKYVAPISLRVESNELCLRASRHRFYLLQNELLDVWLRESRQRKMNAKQAELAGDGVFFAAGSPTTTTASASPTSNSAALAAAGAGTAVSDDSTWRQESSGDLFGSSSVLPSQPETPTTAAAAARNSSKAENQQCKPPSEYKMSITSLSLELHEDVEEKGDGNSKNSNKYKRWKPEPRFVFQLAPISAVSTASYSLFPATPGENPDDWPYRHDTVAQHLLAAKKLMLKRRRTRATVPQISMFDAAASGSRIITDTALELSVDSYSVVDSVGDAVAVASILSKALGGSGGQQHQQQQKQQRRQFSAKQLHLARVVRHQKEQLPPAVLKLSFTKDVDLVVGTSLLDMVDLVWDIHQLSQTTTSSTPSITSSSSTTAGALLLDSAASPASATVAVTPSLAAAASFASALQQQQQQHNVESESADDLAATASITVDDNNASSCFLASSALFTPQANSNTPPVFACVFKLEISLPRIGAQLNDRPLRYSLTSSNKNNADNEEKDRHFASAFLQQLRVDIELSSQQRAQLAWESNSSNINNINHSKRTTDEEESLIALEQELLLREGDFDPLQFNKVHVTATDLVLQLEPDCIGATVQYPRFDVFDRAPRHRLLSALATVDEATEAAGATRTAVPTTTTTTTTKPFLALTYTSTPVKDRRRASKKTNKNQKGKQQQQTQLEKTKAQQHEAFSATLEASIGQALVVYDTTALVHLVDYMTSGFLKRLGIVTNRPLYNHEDDEAAEQQQHQHAKRKYEDNNNESNDGVTGILIQLERPSVVLPWSSPAAAATTKRFLATAETLRVSSAICNRGTVACFTHADARKAALDRGFNSAAVFSVLSIGLHQWSMTTAEEDEHARRELIPASELSVVFRTCVDTCQQQQQQQDSSSSSARSDDDDDDDGVVFFPATTHVYSNRLALNVTAGSLLEDVIAALVQNILRTPSEPPQLKLKQQQQEQKKTRKSKNNRKKETDRGRDTEILFDTIRFAAYSNTNSNDTAAITPVFDIFAADLCATIPGVAEAPRLLEVSAIHVRDIRPSKNEGDADDSSGKVLSATPSNNASFDSESTSAQQPHHQHHRHHDYDDLLVARTTSLSISSRKFPQSKRQHQHVRLHLNVERFAASDQWLCVYDTLVSPQNMKALDPLFADDSSNEQHQQQQNQQPPQQLELKSMSFELVASRFVIPCLTPDRVCVFSLSLHRLHLYYARDFDGQYAVRMHFGALSMCDTLRKLDIVASLHSHNHHQEEEEGRAASTSAAAGRRSTSASSAHRDDVDDANSSVDSEVGTNHLGLHWYWRAAASASAAASSSTSRHLLDTVSGDEAHYHYHKKHNNSSGSNNNTKFQDDEDWLVLRIRSGQPTQPLNINVDMSNLSLFLFMPSVWSLSEWAMEPGGTVDTLMRIGDNTISAAASTSVAAPAASTTAATGNTKLKLRLTWQSPLIFVPDSDVSLRTVAHRQHQRSRHHNHTHQHYDLDHSFLCNLGFVDLALEMVDDGNKNTVMKLSTAVCNAHVPGLLAGCDATVQLEQTATTAVQRIELGETTSVTVSASALALLSRCLAANLLLDERWYPSAESVLPPKGLMRDELDDEIVDVAAASSGGGRGTRRGGQAASSLLAHQRSIELATATVLNRKNGGNNKESKSSTTAAAAATPHHHHHHHHHQHHVERTRDITVSLRCVAITCLRDEGVAAASAAAGGSSVIARFELQSGVIHNAEHSTGLRVSIGRLLLYRGAAPAMTSTTSAAAVGSMLMFRCGGGSEEQLQQSQQQPALLYTAHRGHRCIHISDSQLDLVSDTIAELAAVFRNFELSTEAEEQLEERVAQQVKEAMALKQEDRHRDDATTKTTATTATPTKSAATSPNTTTTTIELHMRSTTMFLFSLAAAASSSSSGGGIDSSSPAVPQRLFGFAWQKADVERRVDTRTGESDIKLRVGHMLLTDYSSPGSLYPVLFRTDVQDENEGATAAASSTTDDFISLDLHLCKPQQQQEGELEPQQQYPSSSSTTLRGRNSSFGSVASATSGTSAPATPLFVSSMVRANSQSEARRDFLRNSVMLRTSRTSLVVAPAAIVAAIKEIETLIAAVQPPPLQSSMLVDGDDSDGDDFEIDDSAAAGAASQQQRHHDPTTSSLDNTMTTMTTPKSSSKRHHNYHHQSQQQNQQQQQDLVSTLMHTHFDVQMERVAVTVIRHRTSDECIVVTPGSLSIRSEVQFDDAAISPSSSSSAVRQHTIVARAVGTNMTILGNPALAVSDNIIEAAWTLRPSALYRDASSQQHQQHATIADHIHCDVKGISLAFSHSQFRFVLALLGDHWSWLQRRHAQLLLEQAAATVQQEDAEREHQQHQMRMRMQQSDADEHNNKNNNNEHQLRQQQNSSRMSVSVADVRVSLHGTIEASVQRFTAAASSSAVADSLTVAWDGAEVRHEAQQLMECTDLFFEFTKTHAASSASGAPEEEVSANAADARVVVSERALSCLIRDILLPAEEHLFRRVRPEARVLLRDKPEMKLDADVELTPSHYLHASAASGFVYFTLDLAGHTLKVTPDCFVKMAKSKEQAAAKAIVRGLDGTSNNNMNNSAPSTSTSVGGGGNPEAETILIIDAHCVLVLTNGTLSIPEFFTMHTWTALGFASRLVIQDSVTIDMQPWPLTPMSVLRASGRGGVLNQQQQHAAAARRRAATAPGSGHQRRSVSPQQQRQPPAAVTTQQSSPIKPAASRRIAIHTRSCAITVVDHHGKFLQGVSAKLDLVDTRVFVEQQHQQQSQQLLSGLNLSKHSFDCNITQLQSFQPNDDATCCVVLLPTALRVLMSSSGSEQRSVSIQTQNDISFGVRLGMLQDLIAEGKELAAIFEIVDQSSDTVDKVALSRDSTANLHDKNKARRSNSNSSFASVGAAAAASSVAGSGPSIDSSDGFVPQSSAKQPQQHQHLASNRDDRPKPPQLMTAQKLKLLEIAVSDAQGEWTEVGEAARNIYALASSIGAFESTSTTIDFAARHIDCLLIGPADASFGEARLRDCVVRYTHPVTKLELAVHGQFCVFNTEAGSWEPTLEQCGLKLTWDTSRASNTVSLLVPNIVLGVSPAIVGQMYRILDLGTSAASALRRKLKRDKEREVQLKRQQQQQSQPQQANSRQQHHHAKRSSGTLAGTTTTTTQHHHRRDSSTIAVGSVDDINSESDFSQASPTTAATANMQQQQQQNNNQLPLLVRNFTRRHLLVGDVSVPPGLVIGGGGATAANSSSNNNKIPAVTILARSSGEFIVTLLGEETGVQSAALSAMRPATVWLGPYLCEFNPAELSVVDPTNTSPLRTLTVFSSHHRARQSASPAVISIRSYVGDVDLRVHGIADVMCPGDVCYLHSDISLDSHLVIEPLRQHTEPTARYKVGDPGTAIYPLSLSRILDGLSCRLNCWQIPGNAQQQVFRGVFLRLESVNKGMILGMPHYEVRIRGCFTIENLLPDPMTSIWTQRNAGNNSNNNNDSMFSFQLPPMSTREVTLLSSPLEANVQLIVACSDDDRVYSAQDLQFRGATQRCILRTAEGHQAAREAHQAQLQQQHLRRSAGGGSGSTATMRKPKQSELSLQVNVRLTHVKFFVPFVLVNHAPVPLQLFGSRDPDPTTRNWHGIPPHTKTGICIDPAPGTTAVIDPKDRNKSTSSASAAAAAAQQDGGKVELSVNVAFFDFRSQQAVPLHVVGTTGLLHLVNQESPDIMFLTFRTTFASAGRETRTVVISPRWAFVNRCPFSIKVGQDIRGHGHGPHERWAPRNVIKMPPGTAAQSYMWSAPEPVQQQQQPQAQQAQQQQRNQQQQTRQQQPQTMEEVGFRAVVTAATNQPRWEIQGAAVSAIKIDSVGTWLICITDPDGTADTNSSGIIVAEAEVIEQEHYVFIIIRLPVVHPVVLSNHTAVPLSVVDPRLNRSRVEVPAFARRNVVTLPPFESSATQVEASTTAKQKAKTALITNNSLLQSGWMVQIEVLGTIASFDLFDADNQEPTLLSDTGVRICFARGRHGQRMLTVEPVPRIVYLQPRSSAAARGQQQQQQTTTSSSSRIESADRSITISPVPVAGVALIAEVRNFSLSLCHRAKEVILLTVAGTKLSVNRVGGLQTSHFVIASYQVDNMGEAHPPFPVCVFTLRNRSEYAVSINVKRKLSTAEHFMHLRSVTVNVQTNVVQVGDALLLNLLGVFDAMQQAASSGGMMSTTSNNGTTSSSVSAAAALASRGNHHHHQQQHQHGQNHQHFFNAPCPSDTDLFAMAPTRSDVRDTMVVIDELAVNPITLRVWLVRQRSHDIFEAAGQGSLVSLLTIDMKDVAVVADGIVLRNKQDTLEQHLLYLNSLYGKRLSTQLMGLLMQYVSSIPFLGAPVRFLHTLGRGFARFFMEPIVNIDSEADRAVAFVRGTAAAVGGVVGGVFGILGDVTESGAHLASIAAGDDDDYRAKRSMVPGTARGLFRGLTGLVMKPIEGFQEDGVMGLALGMGQGLVGVVASPVAGVLNDVSRVSGSIAEVVTDRALPSTKRVRQPRVFSETGALVPLDFVAEIFEHQRLQSNGVTWSNSLLASEGAAFADAKGDASSKQRIEAKFQLQVQVLLRQRIIRAAMEQQSDPTTAAAAAASSSTPPQQQTAADLWRVDRVGTNFSGWMYASVLKDWTFIWTTASPARPLRRRRWVLTLREFEPSRIAERIMGTAFDSSQAHARATHMKDRDLMSNPDQHHQLLRHQHWLQQIQQRNSSGGSGSGSGINSAIVAAVFPSICCAAWVVEIIENERYYPIAGWSQKMMPSDPPAVATRSGIPLLSMRAQLDALVPPGWQWHGSWVRYATEYASDFDSSDFSVENGAMKVVRRTIYRRVLVFKG